MKGKNFKIVLWVLTIFMIISALVYFPSVASIIMLLFAAIAIPLEPVRNFWKEKRLFGLTKGILLTVLFFVSVGMAPTSDKAINDEATDRQSIQQSEDSRTLDATDDRDQEVLPDREPASETNPAVEPEPETEPVPTLEADPDVESEPADEPDTESEPVSASEPDLTPEPEPVEEPNPGTAPSENTDTPSTSTNPGNADNFNTYDNEDQQQTSSQWVLNTSTKKIHYPSCSQVKKIAPQNYSTSNLSESELIAQGYTTCGVCHK